MKRRLLTVSSITIILIASLFSVLLIIPYSVLAQTETWYARNTAADVLSCGSDLNKDASTTQGTAVATHTLDGTYDYWYADSGPKTIQAGGWNVSFWTTTAGGGGPAAKVTVVIERVDSSCTVQQSILSEEIGMSKGTTKEYTTTGSNPGSVTLASGERIIFRFAKTSGTRQVDLRYDYDATNQADTRMIHPTESGGTCDAITVDTSDPAGDLWFNETIEPDGNPWTTELNISASYQTGVTPALNVTNDASISCDITIKLMSTPGTGRSMKYNTTNNAPWPTDSSKEVPVDPSSVTVCTSVASSGLCQIWLWVDYEDAAGGNEVITVRVESAAS